jgi:hypothetical protein
VVLEEALEGEDNVGGEGEGGLALELTLRQLSLQLRGPDKESAYKLCISYIINS